MISWINVLKGACALLVVIAHEKRPVFFGSLLIPVFLSGFFFAAGYTYHAKEKYVLKEAVKTLKVMLCVTVFRLAAFTLLYATVWSEQREAWSSVPLMVRAGRYFCDLWFFPCMLMAKTMFHLLHKVRHEALGTLLALALSCLGGGLWLFPSSGTPKETFWHLPVALLVQGVMQAAYLYKKIAEWDIVKRIEAVLLPAGITGFILLLIYMPMDADLRTGYFTNPFYYILHTVVELPIFVIGCRKVAHNPFLEFLGVNSGFFYGYQAPFIYLCSALFTRYAAEMTDRYICLILQTAVVTVCISAVIWAQNALGGMCRRWKKGVSNVPLFWKRKAGKGK